MVYLFEDLERFGFSAVSRAFVLVPPHRRLKASSYCRASDRCLSLQAWLLLRYALRREAGIVEAPPLGFGAHGKPFFPSLPGVHFNLSHCSSGVACALGREPVGVDVEEFGSFDERLAAGVLCGGELSAVMSGERGREFARYWTMKESYAKLTGEGLGEGLQGLLWRAASEGVAFSTFFRDKGYACTVCSRSGQEWGEPIVVSLRELLS